LRQLCPFKKEHGPFFIEPVTGQPDKGGQAGNGLNEKALDAFLK
jgi:hypothetical protein